MTRIKLRYCYSFIDARDKVRYVVRRKGKSVTIKGEPGSAEFMDNYHRAVGLGVWERSKTPTGSIWDLATEYFQSPEYLNLAPNSQKLYRGVLERVSHRIGDLPIKAMPRSAARKILGEIGSTRKGMANLTLGVMGRVFAFGVQNDIVPLNPFQGIKSFKGGEHHSWTDQELTIFEGCWPLGTRERLAYAVLLYTGQRSGDCVKIKRSDIRNGVIHLTQQKTGKSLAITIHADLDRAIRSTLARGIYLIGDAAGRPMTQGGLYKLMKRAVEKAGLPKRCVTHGLRKAVLRTLAEQGASTRELKAVSGHETLAQVEHYTDAADQARMNKAAMARLKREE